MKWFASFIAGAMLCGGVTTLVLAHQQPYCPAEDSCAIDYSHGKWTITEVTP